ncbi:MAG: hypothetical protein M1829_005747 [Trizodia sp. TS-e1964]|nr:MAG: hypothetical protein M1829_005747 [Trizodia sp. TS-e1964]
MASLQVPSLPSSVPQRSSSFLAQTSPFSHVEEAFDIDLDLPNDQTLDIDTDLMVEDALSDDGHQDISGGEMATDDIMQDEPISSTFFNNDHFTAQDEILQDANDIDQENLDLPLTSWSDSIIPSKLESTSTLEISHFSTADAKSPNFFGQHKEDLHVETDAIPDFLQSSYVTRASHAQEPSSATLPESAHASPIQNNHGINKNLTDASLTHLSTEEFKSHKGEISNHTENTNQLGQIDKNPEPYYTLHPVVVVYGDEEISLFPNEDSTQTFFVKDESLATSTINNLFSAIREVLAADLTDSDELEFRFEDLELILCEDSIHTNSVTLSQIIDLHVQLLQQDGIADPDPLYMTVTSKESFLKSLGVLSTAANEGKGISQIAWNETEGDVDYPAGNSNHEIVEPENPAYQGLETRTNPTPEPHLGPEIIPPKQTSESINQTNNPASPEKVSHEVELTVDQTSGNTKVVGEDKILQERTRKYSKALKLIPVDNAEAKIPVSGSKSAMSSPDEDEDGDLIDYEDADDEEAQSAPFELSTMVNPANSGIYKSPCNHSKYFHCALCNDMISTEAHSDTATLRSRRSSEVSINMPNSIIQIPEPSNNMHQEDNGNSDSHNDHTFELQSVINESTVVDQQHAGRQVDGEPEALITAEYDADQYEDDGTYLEDEPDFHPDISYPEEQEEAWEGDEPANPEALNGVDGEANDANDPDTYDSYLEPRSAVVHIGELSDEAENSSFHIANDSLPEQNGYDEHEITYDEDEDEYGELILDRHLSSQENVSVLSRSASSTGKRPRSGESSGNGDSGNTDAKRVRSE